MPIYEYSCPEGHGRFQLRQGFDSEPMAPCPTCGVESRRLFSTPAILFKGSGWYATDSRGSYESNVEKSEDKGDNGGSAPKETSTDKDKAAAPPTPVAPAASSETG